MAKRLICISSVLLLLVSSASVLAEFSREGSSNPSEGSRRLGSQSQCQIERLKAQEPQRRVESEAGHSDYFDARNKEFDCAGVAAVRRTIRPNGLLLPQFSNAPSLVYVIKGRGISGTVVPGCPESFQSFQQQSEPEQEEQRRGDSHQQVHRIREGDVIAFPAGVAHWCHNDGESELVTIQIMDTSNTANQLDRQHRQFLLAGSKKQQRGRQQYGESESESESEGENSGSNVLSGFSTDSLANAMGINRQLAEKLKGRNDQRGEIVQVQGKLDFVGSTSRRGRSEEGSSSSRDNGMEQAYCTMRIKENIGDHNRADIYNPNSEDPFYILDLNVVTALYNQWVHHLNFVRPFYAVKCNPEPTLLSHLASLGCDFDCASRHEIETVLSLGVSPTRIVYANPFKAGSHIRFAKESGVDMTTIDSVYELEKMRRYHPNCSLLLRVKPPHDVGVRQSFGSKCGVLPDEIGPILRIAKSMGLEFVGVSFHVGTDASVVETYDAAIGLARVAFDVGVKIGHRMHVLDIGGGFTASGRFVEASQSIKSYLKSWFGEWPGLKVMAEPGRYFAEKAFTLATCVIGKRVRDEMREYWISDGMYGSMGCIRLDDAKVELHPLQERGGDLHYSSTVFGPTLDSIDEVGNNFLLPEMEVGEWLVSPNMGAYTKTLGTEFNGFSSSSIPVYVAKSS